jgi:AAA domain-containing protein
VTGPYASAAWAYRSAGWAGVLPLPPGAKWPPPAGYTGWAGVEPSGPDVQAWVDGPQGAGNVALRLPAGLYGLDVDNYEGKHGGAALAAAVTALGALPPTWIVTSRDDGVSGIRLYRAELPVGRRWRDEPAGHGAGIEAIHLGHRYAVVWPSLHPDTGRKYVWRRPDGIGVDGEVPELGTLPELPPAWVEALSEPGEVRTGELAGHVEAVELVTGWREGEPCPRVRDARTRALQGLAAAAEGAALHPVSVAGVHELINLGWEGHAGVRLALAEHYAGHVAVRRARGEDGGPEWWRAVRGAIGKLPGSARERCDCDLWAGEGLTFTPLELGVAPAGAGDPWDVPAVVEGEVIETRPADTGAAGAPLDLADELIARMLTPAQLRDRPAPAWLIEGLLTCDSASWLIAAPGSYKSFVALDWAGHVGVGRDWMGRAVAAGGVVYVVAEGAAGMGPRIRAWEQRNGPMPPEVLFLPMPVQIGREDHWAALVEACRRLRPALILLDTQARITVGLDENDNTAMGEVVEAIERLRGATGACVLVVHHTGRSGRHARGASAIDGAQDTELRLTRTADRRVVLEIDKSKHAADDVRVELELFLCELDGGGSSLVVGPPVGAVAVRPWDEDPTDRKARILAVLHDQFSESGGTAGQVLSVLRERGWTDDYPKTTFYRWWNDLQREDKIERVLGTQRWVVVMPEMGRVP